MKRLTAVIDRNGCDDLAKRLVWLSCVDVDVVPQIEGESSKLGDVSDETDRIRENLEECARAISLLSGRGTTPKSGLFSAKPELPRGDADAEMLAEAESIIRSVSDISRELDSVASDRALLATELEALHPWRGFDIPTAFTGTAKTDICSGSLPSGTNADALAAEIEEKLAAVLLYKNQIDGVSYVSFAVHKSDAQALARMLSAVGFVKSPVAKYKVTSETAGHALEEKLMELDEKTAGLYREADALAPRISRLQMYYDAESTRQSFVDAKKRMFNTEYTAIITGWVPESSADEVISELESAGAAYELRDPEENEDVPVLLKNNKFAESFEPVVGLYSLPKYGAYDPTMVMSIFYLIIFALMFADVGYGLVLLVGCLLGLKLMKPRGSLKKFLQMFAYCGVACMVTGVLFGGYFGDLPTKMAVNMFGAAEEADLALWFNPINDPMTFLVVSLAIGAIHLVGALAVKFYILWRSGKRLDAVFDAGAWILVFLGAGIAIVGVMLGNVLSTVGLVLVILGYLTLICTQGRAEKNPVMKVLKGLMALYDTISYVSDLLSYSRILSLGLASAVIASVFNIIGTMGGFSFGGIVIFVIAVLVGHLLNIAINVLGSFVHTSRLQYIEFFGKFYDDGGRAFVPLEPMAKYHVYKEKT